MAELTAPQPTKITVNLSYKTNMGNYETMDVHLGVEDFTRNGESAPQAFDRVFNFVQNRLIDKVTEIKSTLQ